jgi:hypothetical protein
MDVCDGTRSDNVDVDDDDDDDDDKSKDDDAPSTPFGPLCVWSLQNFTIDGGNAVGWYFENVSISAPSPP